MKVLIALLPIALAGCTSILSPKGMSVCTFDNMNSIGEQKVEVVGSPEIVKASVGKATRFDGESDGLVLPVNPVKGWAEFTVEMLIKPDAGGPREQRFLHFQDESNSRGLLELRMFENGWALDAFLFSSSGQRALFDQAKLHPADRWTWVAMTYKDGKLTSYIDGEKELEGDVSFPVTGTGSVSVGMRQNRISFFKGEIREVRFHQTSLPAGKLQSVRPR